MLMEIVKSKLEEALPGAQVVVQDDSDQHIGHGAPGAHLSVQVVYAGFAGKSPVEQHRMIYQILQAEMENRIHALALRTRAQ